PMGIVTHRVVVTTDASTKGWGAVREGRSVNGRWSAAEAESHINVLELQMFFLALRFHRAQVDLFANRQNTCFPLWFSLGGDDPPLGVDALGHQCPAVPLYAFLPIPLLLQLL